jgi:hypothetical protein
VKEGLVLRALVQEPELLRPHGLRAEEFSDGPRRALAALALTRVDDPDAPDPFADLSTLDEGVSEAVAALSLEDGPPLTPGLVAENVARMRSYARQRRLQELNTYIEPLLSDGRLRNDDPLYLEWKDLQSAGRYSDAAKVGG